jgi:hypothetical protein
MYFVKQDPMHGELIRFVDGKLSKELMVLDFAHGNGTEIGVDKC